MNSLFRLAGERKRSRQAVLLLALIGLAVRVAAVLIMDDYHSPVTAEYGVVAGNLAEGKGFVGGGWLGPEGPTALNVPLYPLLLAIWLKAGGSLAFLGIELTQALLSALLVLLVYGIASRLGSSLAALLAAGLTAFYPPLIYFCKQVSPAILAAFSAAASLYALLALLERPALSRAAVSGLVLGIGVMAEPVLALALAGTLCFSRRLSGPTTSRASIRRSLAVCLLACALVVLPWTVRNYLVFGRLVLLKTSFGLNFWMGNNPKATGFLYTASGEPMQDTLPEEMRASLAKLNEADRYARLGRDGWNWVLSHPLRFGLLSLKRLGYFWWISPTYQVAAGSVGEPKSLYLLRAILQGPLLVLGLIGGMVAWRRDRTPVLIVLWWLIAFTLPYCISVAGNTRYRLPAEPLLLIWAAFALEAGMQRWRLRRTD